MGEGQGGGSPEKNKSLSGALAHARTREPEPSRGCPVGRISAVAGVFIDGVPLESYRADVVRYQSERNRSNDPATREEENMRTILKYRLDVRSPELTLPAMGKIVHVAHEPNLPAHCVTVWADCPDVPYKGALPDPKACRYFDNWEIAVFQTGQAIPVDFASPHLGTAVCVDTLGNQLVWHVYGRPRV